MTERLASAVIECFNGLTGEARKKAIDTGKYDALIEEQARAAETVEDDDPFARSMRAEA